MVQHLWNNIVESTQSKQKDPLTGRRINPVLLELVKAMQGVWDQESPLKKEGLVSAAVEAHEASKKEEPDGSRKKTREATTRKQLGAQVAVSIHAIGTGFLKNVTVKDARRTAGNWSKEKGLEGMVEFQIQVTGHEASEKAVFFKELLGLTDWSLAAKLLPNSRLRVQLG